MGDSLQPSVVPQPAAQPQPQSGQIPLTTTLRFQVEDGAGNEYCTQLGAAGRLLGTSPDPSAIAAAIESIKPDEWDPSTLDGLRQVGLDVGAELRRIAAEHDQDDDDH